MRRYNSVMHRALLALLGATTLFAQKLPFDAPALLDLARIGDPQISPDGRLVAYQVQTVDVPNNKKITQIYVTPVAGGTARQITQAGQDNERPRWSPDSRRIAFISDRGGSSQIWLMDPDGLNPRQVTNLASEAGGEIFSPDGKNLVFTSDVYPDCGANDACNRKAIDDEKNNKVKARILPASCTGIGTNGRVRGAAICWSCRCLEAKPAILRPARWTSRLSPSEAATITPFRPTALKSATP